MALTLPPHAGLRSPPAGGRSRATARRRRVLAAVVLALIMLSLCAAAPPTAASVGPTHLVVSDFAELGVGAPDVSYNAKLGKYLVVWERVWAADDTDIYGAILNADGSIAVDPFWISEHSTPEYCPKAASADSDYWVVAWVEALAGNAYEVQACQFGQDGPDVASAYFTITTSDLPIYRLDIGASVTNGQYLLVWDAEISFYYSDIRGQRFAESAGLQGSELMIATGSNERAPSVNQRGRDFLVAWECIVSSPSVDYPIVARAVSSDGALGDYVWVWDDHLARDNMDTNVASDASSPEHFLVVWSHEHRLGNTDFDIGYAFVSSAAVERSGLGPANSYSEVEPCAAYSGLAGTFLVGYSALWLGPTADDTYSLFVRLLTRQGVFGPVETVADALLADEGRPQASPLYNQGGVVVVWDRFASGSPDSELYARDWSPGDTTIGLYDPGAGVFYLRNANAAGPADATFRFGPAGMGWLPVGGDWDGDVTETIGLYQPSTGRFYLKNTNSAGAADLTFRFGPSPSAWLPIAGDWNGDGVATIGLYDAATGTFYLRNSNSAGPADLTFRFGPPASGWLPVTGDWDGSGADSIGLYSPAAGTFFLRNSNSAGPADLTFRFGPASSAWKPIAGDWNHDLIETVGLYNPATGIYYLRNTNAAGPADVTFRFGPAGTAWQPLAGDWNGI